MTSIFSSIFNSNPQIAARVETMRNAEAALVTFMSRFNGSDNNQQTSTSSSNTSSQHTWELLDTKIPRASVPLKQGKACQIFPSRNKEEEEHYVIHGIKVTSKLYQEQYGELKKSDKNHDEAPLVILHGYMNGALYFYRNLLGLSNHSFQGTVYALDMLGWGLSSRPRFDTLASDKDKTYATEQVFVESLEAWRKEHKLEKMTLAGHSMGGYMATAYCEKYPQHVNKLILISPAGVSVDTDMDVEGRMRDAPLRFRMIVGFASTLWNWGINPASFLRNLPETRGRSMVDRYIAGRLPAITCPDEQKHLGEYLYTNAALPGSGEHSLNTVLKPTTFAYKPTLHRIPKLKVKEVSFIYGQNDWMDPQSGGIESLKQYMELQSKNANHTPHIQVFGVRNAGHLLMLENWQEFNAAMILADGKGHRLPQTSPRPFKVLETGSNLFFAQSRFNRKEPEKQVENWNESNTSSRGENRTATA